MQPDETLLATFHLRGSRSCNVTGLTSSATWTQVAMQALPAMSGCRWPIYYLPKTATRSPVVENLQAQMLPDSCVVTDLHGPVARSDANVHRSGTTVQTSDRYCLCAPPMRVDVVRP